MPICRGVLKVFYVLAMDLFAKDYGVGTRLGSLELWRSSRIKSNGFAFKPSRAMSAEGGHTGSRSGERISGDGDDVDHVDGHEEDENEEYQARAKADPPAKKPATGNASSSHVTLNWGQIYYYDPDFVPK